MIGDRSESAMTALVEAIAEKISGPDVWAEMPLFNRYKFKEWLLPVLDATVAVLDAEPHQPKRDDEVATWIKRERDEHAEQSPWWMSLDGLLDNYRLHADTGTPLTEDANPQRN